jgi:hypothetical protein
MYYLLHVVVVDKEQFQCLYVVVNDHDNKNVQYLYPVMFDELMKVNDYDLMDMVVV